MQISSAIVINFPSPLNHFWLAFLTSSLSIFFALFSGFRFWFVLGESSFVLKSLHLVWRVQSRVFCWLGFLKVFYVYFLSLCRDLLNGIQLLVVSFHLTDELVTTFISTFWRTLRDYLLFASFPFPPNFVEVAFGSGFVLWFCFFCSLGCLCSTCCSSFSIFSDITQAAWVLPFSNLFENLVKFGNFGRMSFSLIFLLCFL